MQQALERLVDKVMRLNIDQMEVAHQRLTELVERARPYHQKGFQLDRSEGNQTKGDLAKQLALV